MRNVKMVERNDVLTITVSLTEDYGRSKSGKSVIIASTDGNVDVPGHPEIKIGVNVYKQG